MLGCLLSRILLLVTGYIYPAYECYKILDRKKRDYDQMKFWCKYWIIIAMLTAVERVADVFFSWLPFYGEGKILFVIYLWNSHTQGVHIMYEEFFRPLILKHEAEIDVWLSEMKIRAMDFAHQKWRLLCSYALQMYLNPFVGEQSQQRHNSNPLIMRQPSLTKHQLPMLPHPNIVDMENEEEEGEGEDENDIERRMQVNFGRRLANGSGNNPRNRNVEKDYASDEEMLGKEEKSNIIRPYYDGHEEHDSSLPLSTLPSASPPVASPPRRLRTRNTTRLGNGNDDFGNGNENLGQNATPPKRTYRRRIKT